MRPEDDYTHPVGPEVNFNESMYFHVHDPGAGLGGFVRLANRPNEGRGEMTICLYLPDGKVAFAFQRPEVLSNERFDAAGLRFVVREPFQHIDITFDGEVFVLDDPSQLADPGAAFRGSRELRCALELAITGVAPVFDHTFETGEESFAPHHYEQLLSARGRVRIGARSTEVVGYGLRDHSWGPRSWQAPWFYRWLHGSTDGFGFMAAWFGRPDGSAIQGGFVWDGTELASVDSLRIVTERDDRDEQTGITATLEAGGREWIMTGKVLSKLPLRNRRQDDNGEPQVTRIVEALMQWSLSDGTALHGMSEYLDQIVDGRPVGQEV
ncbi:DUF7064 domain-containing protein [Amycolatopsis echigonensis]|uniref:DUF7064 domain-containing protein n=1 Tax=Amycolatopsis echigonensis TaxID=2576905 RepID=UPI0028AF27C6|nr:hypothetical protein [Amycolatopsis echigonensis]